MVTKVVIIIFSILSLSVSPMASAQTQSTCLDGVLRLDKISAVEINPSLLARLFNEAADTVRSSFPQSSIELIAENKKKSEDIWIKVKALTAQRKEKRKLLDSSGYDGVEQNATTEQKRLFEEYTALSHLVTALVGETRTLSEDATIESEFKKFMAANTKLLSDLEKRFKMVLRQTMGNRLGGKASLAFSNNGIIYVHLPLSESSDFTRESFTNSDAVFQSVYYLSRGILEDTDSLKATVRIRSRSELGQKVQEFSLPQYFMFESVAQCQPELVDEMKNDSSVAAMIKYVSNAAPIRKTAEAEVNPEKQ